MADRPGMLLYHEQYAALSRLSDHDFRVVIDALMHYSMTGERVEPEGYMAVIYDLMADKLAHDIEEYNKRVERRKEAARKRWNGDAKQCNAEDSTLAQCNAVQCSALDGNYNHNDNHNHNDNYNHNSLPLPPQGDGEKGEKIPEIFEVMEYAKSAGCDRCDEALARRFIAAQAAKGWMGTDGKPIRNWRTWFDGWYARNVSVTARPAPTSMQYEQRTYTPEELRALTGFMEGDDDG